MCPFRNAVESDEYHRQNKSISATVGFGPCFREKCAMWRSVKIPYSSADAARMNAFGDNGWCGLSGNPMENYPMIVNIGGTT